MVVHAPTIWCHHLNLFRSDKFRKVRTDEAGYAGHAIFAGYVEFFATPCKGIDAASDRSLRRLAERHSGAEGILPILEVG